MEGDLQRNVGENLRAYRAERGLSQEAFAVVLGMHRTYMGGLERGERNLTLRRLFRREPPGLPDSRGAPRPLARRSGNKSRLPGLWIRADGEGRGCGA